MIGPRTTPIGLDIGARRIKAAQWTLSRAGARLTAAACIDRAAPGAALSAEEAASIRGVLERQGFAGQRVVASAPATRVLTSVLELPPKSSGAPLEHIARIELARANGVSPEGMEMALWELPSGTRAVEGTHVFAIALRHADADAMLDALEAAGLHAEAIDMGLLGLARLAMRQNNPGQRAVTGLLDLGASGATIAVLHGGTLVYQRTLTDLGLERLHARLVESMRIEPDVASYIVSRIGLATELTEEQRGWELLDDARSAIGDYAESIGAEMKASLSYANRRYAAAETESILLAGGGAAVPGVAARIEAAAECSVRSLSPGGGTGDGSADPHLACAAGLALWSDAASRQERIAA